MHSLYDDNVAAGRPRDDVERSKMHPRVHGIVSDGLRSTHPCEQRNDQEAAHVGRCAAESASIRMTTASTSHGTGVMWC